MCPPGTNVTGMTKVTGEATSYMKPDMSKMRLAVRATEPSSLEATDKGNSVVVKVSESLGGFVNTSDIQTSNFELKPNYPVGEDGNVIKGSSPDNFTYMQTLDVTTTPDVVGKLVDTAIEAGTDYIQVVDVIFYSSPESTADALNELRAIAIKNGIETATIMARAAGGQNGGVVVISDSTYTPSVPYLSTPFEMYSDSFGFAAASSSAEPSVVYEGEVDISSSVNLEIELCM